MALVLDHGRRVTGGEHQLRGLHYGQSELGGRAIDHRDIHRHHDENDHHSYWHSHVDKLDVRKHHDVDNYIHHNIHTNNDDLYEHVFYEDHDDNILHHHFDNYHFDKHTFIPAIRLQLGSLQVGNRVV